MTLPDPLVRGQQLAPGAIRPPRPASPPHSPPPSGGHPIPSGQEVVASTFRLPDPGVHYGDNLLGSLDQAELDALFAKSAERRGLDRGRNAGAEALRAYADRHHGAPCEGCGGSSVDGCTERLQLLADAEALELGALG